ncbi:MAG: hypothetical protein WD894_03770 [Pirellulales bacterium]
MSLARTSAAQASAMKAITQSIARIEIVGRYMAGLVVEEKSERVIGAFYQTLSSSTWWRTDFAKSCQSNRICAVVDPSVTNGTPSTSAVAKIKRSARAPCI